MSASTPAAGTLYLVPAPLDFGCDPTPLEQVMPQATLARAATLDHWVCENAKTARAYLNRVAQLHPLRVPLQQQSMVQLPRELHKQGDHRVDFDARGLLQPALQGHDMGLVSEAGMPAVADPGASVVRAAHQLGLPVVPLVGPVSLLLALAASGLNGQHFAFVGYLPIEAAARNARIRELEKRALHTGETQIAIEVPHRNAALLRALLDTLSPTTGLCVAEGLSLTEGRVHSRTVQQWRELGDNHLPLTLPTVFCMGR